MSSSQFTSWGKPRHEDPSVAAVVGAGESKGVSGKCVWGIVHVHMCISVCGGQKSMLGVFFSHFG